jgi:hypothetical protein
MMARGRTAKRLLGRRTPNPREIAVMHGAIDKYRVSTKHPATGRYDRWRIRWELPPDPYTGERRRGSEAGFPTRKAAERRLAEVMTEVGAATYVVPTRDRLGAYLTEWLKALR